MSVRELQESQKMLCKFNIREGSTTAGAPSSKGASNNSSLLVGSDEKIDLWLAKYEVYEIISPMTGGSYRMRCLHSTKSFDEIEGEVSIPITILVPHYEVSYFAQRVFHIEID